MKTGPQEHALRKWTVDVAVPCNKWQSPKWWGMVETELLRAQEMGISIRRNTQTTGALTDTARNAGMASFLKHDSDFVLQFDDDTIPPPGTILRLLELDQPFVCGVYFGRVDIKAGKFPAPLIYRKSVDKPGLYESIIDYYKGEILVADSVGMGCSLIHREVFYAIMERYVLMRKFTGPIVPVGPEDVSKQEALGLTVFDVHETAEEKDYPFYVFESGRTEDHFFCEMAEKVGYKPVVDTRVECGHITEYIIDGEDFWDAVYSMQLHAPQPPTML